MNRKDFLKLAGGALGIGTVSYLLGQRGRPVSQSSGEDSPEYLDGASAFPVFPGPYLQKDAQLAAFLFPADLGALTRLCDQTLNAVHTSPYEYVPLMPFVVVVYVDMLAASLDERDAQVGLIPETELGFWVLAAAMKRTPLGSIIDHLAWFVPYLFVNDSNVIATGREVYGFNKLAGDFQKTRQLEVPHFALDVLAFKRFAQDAVAQQERLLELAPILPAAGQSQPAAEQWANLPAAQNALASALQPLFRLDLGQDVVAFATQNILQNIPLVFLKQLRHAAQPRRASFQAIVEARLRISRFGSGGFFNQGHELRLNALDSHPLAQKLGLLDTQRSGLGAWLKGDCTLGEGVEYAG